MVKITIIGLGLIGGSLGLALKANNPGHYFITGYAHRKNLGELSLMAGAIDRYENDLGLSVQEADLVFISTPIRAFQEIFINISSNLPYGCIVTDTGSSKQTVMQWAEQLLPKHVDFIGGHPMAGKEVSGMESAEKDLFVGCTYCIVKSSPCSERNVETLCKIIRDIGAYPRFFVAEEHDDFVAGISHLPLLLSVSLVLLTSATDKWRIMSDLASSGYRDMTRLAAGNPVINYDLCISNKHAIISWLEKAESEIRKIRNIVSQDEKSLNTILEDASRTRKLWLSKRKSEK